MPLWGNFVGGSYRARSQSIAADTAVNVYAEITENQADVKEATFYGTPGLKLLTAVATSGHRGSFAQDGLTLFVAGNQVYKIDPLNVIVTPLGPVADDKLPVFFASNGVGGNQVALCSGGILYIISLTTFTLTPITTPNTNALSVIAFMDGYFLALERNTVRVWFSKLENGTIWDALDFFARSNTSDYCVGMVVNRNRIWVFGSQTSQVYFNTGNALSPFLPYPGSLMQEGTVNPFCITIIGEAIVWLAQDNQGRNRMVQCIGSYTPQPISTPAISFALASYPTIDDAEVLAYEQEGHPFVIWSFTAGDTSWGYDLRTQQWHQRAAWDEATGTYHRWRARGLCAQGTLLITGDYQTGELYTLDLDTASDNGTTLRRERTAPYLSSENQFIFIDRLELGVERGVALNTGQGSDPVVMLEVSRDSGATYGPPIAASLGSTGHFTRQVAWRKLGRAVASQFVIRLTQTDPVRTVWGPGLWLRATPGSGLR